MKKIYLLLLVFVFISGTSVLRAQIYLNTFTGASLCPTNGNVPAMAANSTGTPVTRTTVTCTATANVFNSTTLNNTASISNTSYIEFSATAAAGYKLDLTSLSFFRQGSNTAPNQVEVRYSTDAFVTSTTWGAAPLTPTAGAVTTWDFADFSTAVNGTITFRIYPYGTQRCDLTAPAAATAGTFRVDDVTINGTVTSVAGNTISVVAVNGAPFNLADCSATASGSVDFTSTGTFNALNTYTAQLSDVTGSFATPVNVGSLISPANAGNIPITIPAGTITGSSYKIQVVSNNPVATSPASGTFTINQGGYCNTNPTDYFRSVASGSWNSFATWQSSNDSTTWIPATAVPGATAAHVVVTNSDSVYLAANTTTQNLTVNSSAIVNALAFTLTASNRFNLLSTASFYQGGAIIAIPGVQQVLAPTSSYHFNGTQSPNSITYPEFGNLFWEPTAPTISGTFQNLNAAAPFNNGLVVRGNMTINLGAAFQVRFNTGATVSRTHTIDGNLNIISANSTAVLQNGSSPVVGTLNIGGNLNVTAGVFAGLSPTGASGDAIVNLAGNINNSGGTIQSGLGAGNYTFNFTGNSTVDAGSGNSFHNVSVAAGKTVTLSNNTFNITSSKTLMLNGNMILGNNDLVVDGTITGGSLTSHIITNGTGLLTRKNILSTGNALFPIAATAITYNPVTITNNDPATIDFSARVEIGINPAIGYPANAINRTWTIKPSATPSSAALLFEYALGDGNASFNYGTNLELGQYIPSTWNIVQSGIVPAGTYTANAPNITSFAGGTASSFVLGNLNSVLAFDGVAVNYFTGIKQNGTHKLSWKISCNSTPSVTIKLERSADARNFVSINSIDATSVRCNQPFDYTDAQPLPGINYYRLKIIDSDGKISYSNIIALINATKGFALMNIAPNPVAGNSFKLNTASATSTKMEIIISDMQGRAVHKQTVSLTAGFNSTDINVSTLAPGTYNICGTTSGDKSGLIRFVKQ